ncbi:transmembrane protein (macronuclear) [Tetrahymena thermophila SB210]|uniref:Transmembrane protein n=1 Tax=Tetrahymena thermophila (strain SB210) TaxID=312017 RepID=I7M141_TETTS|nr:transmembrane protein [Tetrahymena thermophila SB210]EAR94195.1 transmembrane protein [Tetrahymena thermophila SB210]|eukprot:XP_001014440.1 transmembrane protein [Tetrahymena thermophila SB210]
MQRYLVSAAVFPSLYLAWQACREKNTVYAKSKSSSFSRSKSSSSSSSSSSSKKSSSSSLFGSSKTKGDKSLTQKSFFRKSTIAQKPYSKQNGNKMHINKRRFVKDQQQSKQISIFGLLSLLGTVSVYFYRYEKIRYGVRFIKKALNSCQVGNLSHFDAKLEGKLIYGHGPLKTHSWQNKALKDPIFGVQASSNEVMKLYRKVEIFQVNEEKPEQSCWRDSNYINSFHPSIFHQCMKDAYILPQKVEIGDYELSNKQLINFCSEKQTQLSFDTEQIDDYYSDLSYDEKPEKNVKGDQDKQDTIENPQINQKEVNEEFRTIHRFFKEVSEQEYGSLYRNHPFTYAINRNKDIIFENDYIYITNNISQPEEGDLRISFHELQPIYYATIIAQQQGKSFSDFLIKEFENMKLNLKLFVGGQQKNIAFNVVNIIKDGKIELQDLIKEYMTQTKKEIRSTSYILAIIIYLIYTAIADTIGQMMNPFNWFGKRAQERREKNRQNVVQKRNGGYVFNKNNNASFLSYMIAAPFAAVHVTSISLAAFARMYAGVICGGAVAGYILYTCYKDYQDDYQLLNSFSEEEEQIVEMDELDQQVLDMLQNSEIEEK